MADLPQAVLAPADLPQGRVCHLTTGRLRVKIAEKRGDAAFFATVESRLRRWGSIDRIETNPLTGSVLVHFSDLAALFAENERANDLFAVDYDDLAAEAGTSTAGNLTEAAAETFRSADQTVRRWTGGAADLRGAIFTALLLGGLYQLLRGNISVPATTMLWYAGATLRLWDVAPTAASAGAAAARPTGTG